MSDGPYGTSEIGEGPYYGTMFGLWQKKMNWAWNEGRASRDRLLKALIEAKLQIEYLHGKFAETSSGVAVLTRIEQALADDEKAK
jgi:hypothetical protein